MISLTTNVYKLDFDSPFVSSLEVLSQPEVFYTKRRF